MPHITHVKTKTMIDLKFITELKKENIEVESFIRYVARRENLLKENETLDLNEVKTEYLKLQKEIAAKAEAFEKTEKGAPSTVLRANEKAKDARAIAAEERAKAKSYTGKFPQDKNAQDSIKDMLQSELNQITLGMKPADYALKTSNEFIEQLEKLALGRALAVSEVKKLAIAFEKHATALTTNQINTTAYIANCKKDFEASAALLSKPHTFVERAGDFVLGAIRGILNVFDKLNTWLISAETTKADTKGYKFVITTPETALAKKVNSINAGFASLEKEVALSEVKIAIQAEKTSKREELTLKVQKGEAPKEIQEKIAAAKEKEQKRDIERAEERALKKQIKMEAREKRIKGRDERFTQHVISIFNKLESAKKSVETPVEIELHEEQSGNRAFDF
jgi:hypothetical protein